MDEGRHSRLMKYVEAALAQPPRDRRKYLDRACSDDLELRSELESLLVQEERQDTVAEGPESFLGEGDATAVYVSQDRTPTLLIGRSIGRYRILGLLGRGGMGTVYEAEDPELQRRVALKVLPSELATDPISLERFKREARTVAALNHPNVVTVYSVEQDAGTHFLTMELVRGKTLDQLSPDEGVELGQLLSLALPLVEGLRAAHEHGIIHRDLKPANIIVDDEERLRILDFGLAKPPPVELGAALPASPTLTNQGTVMGTVPYMSPEQVAGRTVDHRSDIFSVGVILYELCCGRRPFRGESSPHIMSAILRDDPPSVTAVRGDLPPELEEIVNCCLEKQAEDRYQTTRELRDELEKLQQDVASGMATGAVSMRFPAFPRLRRQRAAFLAGLTMVLATIAIGGFWWWQRTTPPSPPQLDRNRVVVAPFENRIEDPELEKLGVMATDWITQGLSQIENLDLVPTVAALDSVRAIEGSADSKQTVDPLQALAEDTGAGTVVSGTCYLNGDRLVLQAEVFDAIDGRLVHGLEPVAGNRDDPMEVVERLKSQIMGAVAAQDEFLAGLPPPTFEAYREYWSGIEYFGIEPAKSVKHMMKAAELDPDFILPRLHLISAFMGKRKYAEAEALLDQIEEDRDRLTELERLYLDLFRARFEGGTMERLKIARQIEALAPRNPQIAYIVGTQALDLNRPREAVRALSKMDPPFVNHITGGWWLKTLTKALHLLGEHTEELERARAGRDLYPDELGTRLAEAQALAALGRIDELWRLIEESLTIQPLRVTAGDVMVRAAWELRAHGHGEAADKIAEQAVSWYRRRPAKEAARRSNRKALASMLSSLGHLSEARVIFEGLATEHPEDLEYMGNLGSLAARLGETEEARKLSQELQGLDRERLKGFHLYEAARIESVLGEKETAVALLRESFARGAKYGTYLHSHQDLAPLRDYPPFQELLRPKG